MRTSIAAAKSWHQVLGSLGAGLLLGILISRFVDTELRFIVVWDLTAAVYIIWVWLISWPADAEETRARAELQDPSRASVSLSLVATSAVSMVAVVLALLTSTNESDYVRRFTIGIAIVTTVLAWVLVNTVFALEYAWKYYQGEEGSIDFNQDESPTYSDFSYLAFTVGMTFSVPDVNIQSTDVRRTVLVHGLISFLFGTGTFGVAIGLAPNLAP